MNRDSIRRALRTFLISTAALFVPGLLGWLHSLTEWAAGQGATPFPDAHGLAYLGVSAITGGFIALVNLLWNTVEDGIGHAVLRDVTPQDPTNGDELVVDPGPDPAVDPEVDPAVESMVDPLDETPPED